MSDGILVINAGSATLKWAEYEPDGLTCLAGATEDAAGRPLEEMIEGCLAARAMPQIVAHRIVHGGPDYADSIRLDDDHIRRLAALSALAPLHQPAGLAGVAAARRRWPDAIQMAGFDTAFHRGHTAEIEHFALPRALYEAGIRRYGFHGLSYRAVLRRLRVEHPAVAEGRLVIAHLGSGASLCAIHAGRSIDSTMGFTALDGLPMATRCGSLDPGVVLHLLRAGRSATEVEHLLYRESGLLGLSGLSGDMRQLLAARAEGHDGAALAIAHFCSRIARECGALAATLGGLDALIFTGGIGLHAPAIRAEVAARLDWLHIPHLLTIPTDEEGELARDAAALIACFG